MEIIDLPGIKAIPPEAKMMTERLVKHFLAQEHTLALCVVDATCPDLSGQQGIGFVIEQKKEASTIATLTKADLLDRTTIERQLVRRVLKKTGEGIDRFAGCVAVINRTHHDELMLIEAGNEEERTFQSKVFSKMPQNMRQHESAIRHSLGIGNLIQQIEQLYRNYVKDVWKARAIHILQQPKAAATHALDGLGKPPGPELSAAEAVAHLADLMDFDSVASLLEERVKEWCVQGVKSARFQNHKAQKFELFTTTLRAGCSDTEATRLWKQAGLSDSLLEISEVLLEVHQHVTAGIKHVLQSADYMGLIRSAIAAAFNKDSPMKLHRFESLQAAITQQGLPQLLNQATIQQQLLQHLASQLSLFRLGPSLDLDTSVKRFQSLYRHCRDRTEMIISHLILGLIQETVIPLKKAGLLRCMPQGFQLEESNAYKAQRSRAEAKLQTLNDAMHVIVNIDKDMDAPAEGDQQKTSQSSLLHAINLCVGAPVRHRVGQTSQNSSTLPHIQ